jgi:formylglycine-generating enzyme required for sulfatase activity
MKLATVREDGEPTRRRAFRSEFSDLQWKLVSELADHPYRLLITAAPEVGESHAEVAHETIFRRWRKLHEWITAEREFLVWRTGLESARRAWQTAPAKSKHDALLMGLAAKNATKWLRQRAEDIPSVDQHFIRLSLKATRWRQQRIAALVGVLVLAVVASLALWIEQNNLIAAWRWMKVTRPYMETQIRPYVLTLANEQALKPKDSFRECATNCPTMIVVPAGSFIMGSPNDWTERPRHTVTISKPFAVSQYEVTFADWDACSDYGDCPRLSDAGFGRGRQPVIGVTWQEAQHYADWFSKMTGKTYRLLDEAEYEYAARAGSQTAYPWGDDVGVGNTDCNGCGSQADNRRPSPVGSFGPNAFGLYDIVGNVWEWTQDCWHYNYDGAPADGSAWIAGGDCDKHVNRGGSYVSLPNFVRCSSRWGYPSDGRYDSVGFRLARTIAP